LLLSYFLLRFTGELKNRHFAFRHLLPLKNHLPIFAPATDGDTDFPNFLQKAYRLRLQQNFCDPIFFIKGFVGLWSFAQLEPMADDSRRIDATAIG
jgi:hypothetical protein